MAVNDNYLIMLKIKLKFQKLNLKFTVRKLTMMTCKNGITEWKLSVETIRRQKRELP